MNVISYRVCVTFFLSFLFGVFGSAQTKICSITLGSSNEINAIRTELSKHKTGVEFIELTDFSAEKNRQDPWFQKACDAGIQCDVLLISSHYADNFYSSDLKLHLEEMETKSCDRSCSGILERPREVHLLGCSSTSTNGSNLVGNDISGFVTSLPRSRLTENSVTKIRQNNLRKLGFDNADRFRLIFANTPRIFGYTTVGPLGTQIEAEYINYAKRSVEYYTTLAQQPRSELTKPHTAYLQTVGKRSPLSQWAGDAFSGNSPLAKKVCDSQYLKSDQQAQKNSLLAALKIDPFFMFGLLQNFATDLYRRFDFKLASIQLKEFLAQDPSFVEQYKSAFANSKEVISSIQIGEILYLVEAISNSEYQRSIKQLADIYKKNRLRVSDNFAGAMVCGLTQKLIFPNLVVTSLIDLNSLNGEDTIVLSCNSSEELQVHQSIMKHYDMTKDIWLKRGFAEALSKQKLNSIQIEMAILNRLQATDDLQSARFLIRSLGKFGRLQSETEAFLKFLFFNTSTSPILREEVNNLRNRN